MIAAEFKIVANKVEVRFRPDENVVEGVEFDSSSYVAQQVIRTGKVRAGKETARNEGLIKAYALASDSTFHFKCRLLAQGRSKNGIEVVKDRTEGQESLGKVSGGPPEDLTTDPEMMGQQNVGANGGKYSAADRLREKITGSIER